MRLSAIILFLSFAFTTLVSAGEECSSYDEVSTETRVELQNKLDATELVRVGELTDMSDEVVSWYCFHAAAVYMPYINHLELTSPDHLKNHWFSWVNAVQYVHYDNELNKFKDGSNQAESEALRLFYEMRPASCNAEAVFVIDAAVGCSVEYDNRFRDLLGEM